MLSKIEDTLRSGNRNDPPAYTLILGAGASFGVIPTAKEMLGFQDPKTKSVHKKSIPVWLASQLESSFNLDDELSRLACSKAFWQTFIEKNENETLTQSLKLNAEGFPEATSIAAAYKSVFDTSCVGGLDTPERHRSYMRAVTLGSEAEFRLNATHFYLASLLSLQRRFNDKGSDQKPLYIGQREFARTIFTTNFDPILQTSLQLFQILYYMTDRPEFLSADALQTDQHPAIHLFYAHGSVHRPYMANTDGQIAQLKEQNARDLSGYLGSHGVIVLGYSGWDDCLLEALNQTRSFSGNLYWLARGAESISSEVSAFLRSHANAYWVNIDDGGRFMARLHSRLCPGAPNTELLLNPISPLLRQLHGINLSGIGSIGGINLSTETTDLDTHQDVESVRVQVIGRLKDAQKVFVDSTMPEAGLDIVLRQANLKYVNDDWEYALIEYSRVIEEFTTDFDTKALALFRRGLCYENVGKWDLGIADYTAVVNLERASTEIKFKALLNRAARRAEQGNIGMAIADYTLITHLPELSADEVTEAILGRAALYAEIGNLKSELADYQRVIEFSGAPTYIVSQALFKRSLCHSAVGDFEKQRADLLTLLDLKDASPELVEDSKRALSEMENSNVEVAIVDIPEATVEKGISTEPPTSIAPANSGG